MSAMKKGTVLKAGARRPVLVNVPAAMELIKPPNT
jgi:hypothetical protein